MSCYALRPEAFEVVSSYFQNLFKSTSSEDFIPKATIAMIIDSVCSEHVLTTRLHRVMFSSFTKLESYFAQVSARPSYCLSRAPDYRFIQQVKCHQRKIRRLQDRRR